MARDLLKPGKYLFDELFRPTRSKRVIFGMRTAAPPISENIGLGFNMAIGRELATAHSNNCSGGYLKLKNLFFDYAQLFQLQSIGPRLIGPW